MYAVRMGHLDAAKFMVTTMRVDPQHLDPCGYPAILYAAEGGQTEVINWLLDEKYASIGDRSKVG